MGTNNSAANAANAANAQRQTQINNTVNQIQSAYSSPSRAAQVNQYGTNLQNYYDTQVNNQEGINARNLKFAMARSGLSGGSASVDANTQLQKDYTSGLLQASQAAQQGAAALQQSDASAKNQLISQADQGGYLGTIPQQISQAQDASLNATQNFAPASALNNLFSGTAGIYQNEQTAAAQRAARLNPIGGAYGGSSASIYGG